MMAELQTDKANLERLFGRVASVSGSLWFDGFMDYMRSSVPPNGLRRIYLSLGDREKNARNQRMAAVEDCTRQTAELLCEWNIPVMFEMNTGGRDKIRCRKHKVYYSADTELRDLSR